MIVHSCNLNTWEAEARGLLYIEGQPGLESSRLAWATILKKRRERNLKLTCFFKILRNSEVRYREINQTWEASVQK